MAIMTLCNLSRARYNNYYRVYQKKKNSCLCNGGAVTTTLRNDTRGGLWCGAWCDTGCYIIHRLIFLCLCICVVPPRYDHPRTCICARCVSIYLYNYSFLSPLICNLPKILKKLVNIPIVLGYSVTQKLLSF